MPKTQSRTKRKRNKRDTRVGIYYSIARALNFIIHFNCEDGGRHSFKKVLVHRRIWRKKKKSKTNERTVKSTQLEIETSLVNKGDITHSTELPGAC